MALIVGTPVRFRPQAARARGIDPRRVYKLTRLYRSPGDSSYWAVVDAADVTTPVKLNELR